MASCWLVEAMIMLSMSGMAGSEMLGRTARGEPQSGRKEITRLL